MLWSGVGGEGGGGQVGGVVEVGLGEVGPGVADVAGVGDGGVGGDDGVAFDFCGGGEEVAVGAGYFEALERALGFEAGGVVEPDVHVRLGLGYARRKSGPLAVMVSP